VHEFLDSASVFVEFAPGDCRFALEVANHAKTVYAVDISDQRGQGSRIAENLVFITYDGYQLDEVQSDSVDLVFSDQFIEHLHPEDTRIHCELVHRVLKPGGKYVFRTPHAYTGPHDVSRYFSHEPQGFHLKEWTYIELGQLLEGLGYSRFYAIWIAKGIKLKVPYLFCQACEHVLNVLPKKCKRPLGRYLLPSICIVAVK
jgi:SAM-dependent methyltransferase